MVSLSSAAAASWLPWIGQRAVGDHLGGTLDDPDRIGTVADEVAKENVLVGAGLLRIREARGRTPRGWHEYRLAAPSTCRLSISRS